MGIEDERCVMDWRLVIAMRHTQWTSPLGLHTISGQITTLYILVDFSLFHFTKNKGSLGNGLSLGWPPCEAGFISCSFDLLEILNLLFIDKTKFVLLWWLYY
jgi:hypothetical protein